MKIFIAGDHGGFYLKEELKSYLSSKGHKIHDLGNITFDANDDYPDFIFPLAKRVAEDNRSLGIVLGRSGVGEVMAANKVKGVRAALCLNQRLAKKAREHNYANVLALGADYISATTAKRITDVFINTPSSQAKRHKRRIEKISHYESAHLKEPSY